MTTLSATSNEGERVARATDLYRVVWRWHFYAGLLVLPFLILLATTGALYLFRDEIEGIVYRDLKQVELRQTPQRPASVLITSALAAQPSVALKIMPPATPTSSAEITVKAPSGERLVVYVDPYDARVLGTLPFQGTIMWTIRHLHSLKIIGPVARGFIEMAAGWTILLVGTGIFLWWPRKQTGGVLSVRGTPKKRVFWRDLHAVTGIVAGAFITFLAVTGMPWSVVWGDYANQWANGSNYGYPSGLYVDVPMSSERLSQATGPTTWSLEQAQMPLSSPKVAPPIGVDAAIAIFDKLGLTHGYAVSLPTKPTGVYSATVYPDDLPKQRVIHLDQYSGDTLFDLSYAEYGPFARAMEWGINTHLGQQFGLANKIVLAVVCLGIVVMSISAAVMWWKRRPKRMLGVPPMPSDKSAMRGVLSIMVLVGIVYPLVGMSLIAILSIDWLLVRRIGGRDARSKPVTSAS
ncbi:PepSY-associated TM helix domain-containing protein [Microvirga sp. 2MCAF38]|uniref:PepSY-associated TM helix domain-containing protein n=1 Tax=Microvirga sp. 2MCAF38 TaxID=3232989 RepID=UPI003F9AD7D3